MIGELACWRKGPGDVELVYGRHDILSHAIAARRPVRVRDHHGHISEITLSRASAPDRDGWCWGLPLRAEATTWTVTEIAPAKRRTRKPRVRRHR